MRSPATPGWRAVGVAFVLAMFGWGLGFYGPAMYLPALHQSRGWPVATISVAITAHFLTSAVLVAWLPMARRRFGIRRVVLVGVLLTAIGTAAWGHVDRPWHLIPAFLLSGCGWAATSGAALNEMVAPWFDRDRPKAISMAFNGASVGGMAFVPLWAALISDLGLRSATLLIGSAAVVVICPLVLGFLPADSAAVTHARQAATLRLGLVRSPKFQTVSLAFALGLFAQIGLFTHLISRLSPVLGPGLAAAAISLITLCAILGRTLLGWLIGDRDRRLATAISLSVQAGGSLLLAYGSAIGSLTLGCVLFGLGVGNLTSLPPLIAQREFSITAAATVVALVTSINQAVFAFAPGVFGELRDATDSYVLAFVLAGVLQVISAAVILYGRRFS